MQALEKNLHHTFKNKELIKLALTHRSSSHNNNQRLEYLGDAVLDCIIAEVLYKKFPNTQEGILSQYRSKLVNKITLTKIAKELNLATYIILGPGEKNQCQITSSILADSLEAIIAAIYLDTDFNNCKSCVLSWFNPYIQSINKNPDDYKDSKTRLQEWCQAQKQPTPSYKITNITGKEHNQCFEAQCTINNLNTSCIGYGSSRRAAEQDAATKMLTLIKKL